MRARMTLRLICVLCPLIVLFAPTSTALSARTKPDKYSSVLFIGTKPLPPRCSSNFDPTFQTLIKDPDVSRFAGDSSPEGSGAPTFEAKLEPAKGESAVVGGDIYSWGRPIKDVLPGLQGCGHFQFQSQGRATAPPGLDYAITTVSTPYFGQISIPADPDARNARIQLTPWQSPLFSINPSASTAGTAGRGWGIIRIGRLELEREDNHDPQSDGPVRADPSADMFRAALHMLPPPAIAMEFNLHWVKR